MSQIHCGTDFVTYYIKKKKQTNCKKMQIFDTKICVYEKKVVPLHAFCVKVINIGNVFLLMSNAFNMKNGNVDWSLVGATVAYVLMWGTGLFCTTFFSAIAKWDLMQIFKEDIVGVVLAPSIVVFALFLWDEAAGIEKTNLPPQYMKKQLKWNFIVIGITLIMLAITGLTDGILQLTSLIIGWIGITAIKFISKYYSDLQIEINKI